MIPPKFHDVVIAICTYNRNKELELLLSKIVEYARDTWSAWNIGITIIDDSAHGVAKEIADRYSRNFKLDLIYKNPASRNISIARNCALESSLGRAEWIAMTDDDCEPSPQWLSELLRVQKATNADVATGLMLRRAPAEAPEWIKRQPFLQLGEFLAEDCEEMTIANTNNCLISTEFLLSRPHLRFNPTFGRIGGEDMEFFHSMKRADAKIVFAARAFVFENEPNERLTFRYQIRRYFWQGNSSVVTSLQNGVGRTRLAIHGGATFARGTRRPLVRLVQGSSPQFRYAFARMAEGVGKFIGVFGVRIKHK